MDDVPATRPSLLLRVRDPRNDQAWEEFLEIYEPLVYRLARQKRFQDADARELTQEVFLAVARAVDRFSPDRSRGSFRGWLFRIARNLMINFLEREGRCFHGTGDTWMNQALEEEPAPDAAPSGVFDGEYRHQAFQWAAGRVREEVQENTWRAFWLTSVEGQEVSQAAKSLGLSPGAVYVARSRVLARLRKKVEELDGDETERMGENEHGLRQSAL